jgi:hypothetical protein
MKTIFFILFLSLCFRVSSQITEDFQATGYYFYFKLNDAESKFWKRDVQSADTTYQFQLYNLDGSLYKTVQMPQYQNSSLITIEWISTSLFDNDPATLEYLAYYRIIGSGYRAKVIREDGTVLLDEPNGYPALFSLSGGWPSNVCSAESGTKLILYCSTYNGDIDQTKVFSLPGDVPSGLNEEMHKMNGAGTLYPNPNNGVFSIKLQNENPGETDVDLFTANGKIIHTYKSSGSPMRISELNLSDGSYFVRVRSDNQKSTIKMILKK